MPPSKPTFDACYQEIDRYVRNAVRRYNLGADSDDAVNEVLWRISRKWEEYDPEKSLEAWVKAFVRRVSAELRSRAHKSHEVQSNGGLVDDVDQQEDPEEQARGAEQYEALIELLRPMREDRRIVFELKVLDEFTGSQIAEMLNIPLATVFSRLRAAESELAQRASRHRKDLLGAVGLQALVWEARKHPALREAHDLALDGLRAPPSGAVPPVGDLPPSGDSPPPASAPPSNVPATTGAKAAGVVAKAAISASVARLAAAGAIVFATGVGAGAAGHAWLRAPVEPPAPPAAQEAKPRPAGEASPASTATASPAPTSPDVAASPSATVAPWATASASGSAVPDRPSRMSGTTKDPHPLASAEPTPSASASAVAAPTASQGLHNERLLIDKADIALQRGDLPAARDALARHARQFPASKWASRRQELWQRLEQMERKK
jgi:RNA polymerase sigma-70 factor, ECF subfamily